MLYITEYNEYACGTPRMETPGVFLYFLRCQNIWIFVEKSICKKRMKKGERRGIVCMI